MVSYGNPDIQPKQFLSNKYTCVCRRHTYTICTYGCSQDIVTSLTHVQFTFACLRRTQFSSPLSIPSFKPLSCRFLHPSSSSVITQMFCWVPLLQNVFFTFVLLVIWSEHGNHAGKLFSLLTSSAFIPLSIQSPEKRGQNANRDKPLSYSTSRSGLPLLSYVKPSVRHVNYFLLPGFTPLHSLCHVSCCFAPLGLCT